MSWAKKIFSFSFSFIFILFCFLLFYFILFFAPFEYKNKNLLENISFSQEVYGRNNDLLRLTLSKDEKYRIKGSIKEVAPHFVQATLLYEDKYFYSHFGVNPFSLLRAFAQTYILQMRTIGASTISMQTARILFDIKSNTLQGKLHQIWKALQLEYYFSKDEILEAYLNLAPYGGNIEGIFAASRIYFQKNAYELLLSESLALAIIPQNPNRRNPLNGKDFNRVRALFEEKWQLVYPQYAFAQVPLNVYSTKDLPFLAPHFSLHVLQNNNEELKQYTSLDSQAQKIFENTIKAFTGRGALYGIENAAALLVHVPSMEARAYVGSADFYNKEIEGENNALDVPRSPGSTLKPFIYALALEQGIIHEGSILLDIPKSFSDYNPENFNAEYSGPLSAQKALKMSRNIPAINLSRQINSPDLYDFLKKAHVDLKEEKEHYGLSLVLGGAEIKALEIAELYAMLLNQGLFEKISFYKNKRNSAEYLLSKEASALALKMLKDAQSFQSPYGKIPLYIKTGTSNAYRDAWAVGAIGEYILLVWVGNFDNSSNPYFIGAKTALPLFYDLSKALLNYTNTFDLLEENIRKSDLTEIEICADTGDVNLNLCPKEKGKRNKTIFAIPGKTPIRDTGFLRSILVDRRTNLRTCQKTLENNDYVDEIIAEFWPSDMQRYYKEVGVYKKAPPPFDVESLNNPLCKPKEDKKSRPIIESPKEGVVYTINENNPAIALTASINYDSAFAFWFVNNNFMGQVERDNYLIYYPKKEDGETLEVVVQDIYGRHAKMTLNLHFE